MAVASQALVKARGPATGIVNPKGFQGGVGIGGVIVIPFSVINATNRSIDKAP
jgi:hypothetical protein